MAGSGRRAPGHPLRQVLAPLPPLAALWLLLLPPGGALALALALPPRRLSDSVVSPGGISNTAENRSYAAVRTDTEAEFRWKHRFALRRLLERRSVEEDGDMVDANSTMGPSPLAHSPPQLAPPAHPRRHQKRLGDRRGGRRSGRAPGPAPVLSAPPRPSPSPSPLLPPSSSSSSPSAPRRRVRAHEACYSSNEVLLVIGVTCAVNFAFILLVVSLVHLCNRGASKTVTAFPEFESVVRGEERARGPGCHESAQGVGQSGAYVRVQEYVDSLPDRPAPFEEDEGETAACRPPCRRPAPLALHGACSMEELLFLD